MQSQQPSVKVLHLITSAKVGGSQDNTFGTAERHNRTRYTIHVACNPAGKWTERAKQSADVFHAVPTLVTPISPLKDLRAFIDIIKLLKRERFDIVHTHTAKAGFLGRVAAWLCRVPIVVHTYHAFPFHEFMPAWKRLLYLTLEKLCRPLTSFFITLSQRDREEGLRLRILTPRSQAIYTGIDFSKLDRAAEPARTRAALGLPADRPIVIMVGRLEPQKAPHLLLEAFARIVENHPKALLLIAGDGELRSVVEERIDRLSLREHVRLLGHRDDVPDLLKLADVFVFSSLWEAMGRSMVEAMLLGKPVVVPAIYGIPEIVRHGQTGLLYSVGNMAELAERVTDILRQPEEARRLGNNARELTRGLFEIQFMVGQIEGAYERLLKGLSSAPASTRGEAGAPARPAAAPMIKLRTGQP